MAMREYKRPEPILGILAEHVEEAAFLYHCRRRTLARPDRSWEDLDAHERRMRPHMAALALGGAHSAKFLKPALTQDEEGDSGEAFVAAALFPMLDLVGPMQWLTAALCGRPPHFEALVDGLKLTKSRNLDGWLEYFLAHENPEIRAVGAEVVGYRDADRLKDQLVVLRGDREPHVSMAAISALAGMGMPPRKDDIVPFLDHPDPGLALKAVEILLTIGSRDALSICREACTTAGPEINKILVFLLAVAGTPGDMPLIGDAMARQPEITGECLLALGLCGHPEAVDLLISRLDGIDSRGTFEAAYQGLRMLTGMDFLPAFDTDEAGPDDIAEYQGLWKEWWGRHRNTFSAESKWRRGERISPMVLYKDLFRPGNPRRDVTYLELVTRYVCPVGFRHDDAFDAQVRKLEEIRRWASGENGKQQPGLPCFYGGPPA